MKRNESYNTTKKRVTFIATLASLSLVTLKTLKTQTSTNNKMTFDEYLVATINNSL